MLKIKKEYIVNSNNKKKAVLIDIETFEKLEELLENYGLGKYMEEIDDEEALNINEAKEYYDILKKN
ncbi:MAG: hypothetical protein XD85_0169 [Parcubacteria bacterium 34_609]|nr:MAG: hypothetical protein XD85_0169 [Parcubacteria bacterium 34_609]